MQKMWNDLKSAPFTARFGVTMILLYALVAIFAPLIAPYGEREIVGDQYMPWSVAHWIGTDALGRDMLSRLIFGARNTVGIALATTILAFVVGTILGMTAAVIGRWPDQVLSRLNDMLMAIPGLIFSMLLLTIFGTSVVTLICVIAVVDMTRVFRLSRALTSDVVVLDFIEAAQLRGDRLPRLMLREILPNISAPLIAEFGLRFVFVFLAISALSFLGLGLQPPAADWGSMVRENAVLMTYGDITPMIPAGAIALLSVSVNFVVDWKLHVASGLRD
jgi:peptide/nickel transport system permease protein